MDPGDVDVGDVHRWNTVDHPVRNDAPCSPTQQDSERIVSGRHPVVLDFRGGAHQRAVVGREALRTGEQLADPHLLEDREGFHGRLKERGEPVPVAGDLPEGEGIRHTLDLPGRGDGLEQPHHQAARFLPVVGVAIRVLEDRHVAISRGDLIRDQVGVLGSL